MESSSWSPSSAVYQGAKQDHHGARCKLNPSACTAHGFAVTGEGSEAEFSALIY